MNHRNWLALAAVLLGYLLVASTMMFAAPIGSAEGQNNLSREERNWEFINHNRFGTNHNPQTQINKENAQYIELKWVAPIPSTNQFGAGSWGNAEGSQAPQLVVDGVVFNVLNRKSILAYDAATGEVVWQWEHPEYDQDAARKEFPIAVDTAHTHGMYFSDGYLVQTDFGCKYTFNDPKTGEVAKQLTHLCVENTNEADGWFPASKLNEAGWGIPTNSGEYRSRGTHPPSTWVEEDLIFHALGSHAEGTYGARHFASARKYSTGELVWRTWLAPPCGDPVTCGPGKDGPLFTEEKAAWGQWLVDNCNKIWLYSPKVKEAPFAVSACDMNQDILRNDWGDMRSNSGISNVWGQMPVDKENGMIYYGTAQPGPDRNGTHAPGPRLFGSAFVALDARTGEFKWAYQTAPRDLWDYDCSWNTMLVDTVVNNEEKRVVLGGCKNGIIYVLDAATGHAYHAMESTFIQRCADICELYDPLDDADMTKPWTNYPDTKPFWMNCQTTGCLEADFAFDPDRNMIYAALYNLPEWASVGNAEVRGVSLAGCNAACQEERGHPAAPHDPVINSSIVAFDVNTGEEKWRYFIDGYGFRGGVIVSGGVVWFAAVDGWARGLDADTGELLYEHNTGSQAVIQPTIGADDDGNMKIFRVIGGRAIRGMGSSQPGAVMAYGLRDGWQDVAVEIREVERVVEVEVIEEVEVVREVEVPGAERIVEVEVEKVVEVEVEKEVEVVTTEEVISPISYVVIGLGVVLAVVGGVLFSRSNKK